MSTVTTTAGSACIDCTMVIANDDYTGMSEDRAIVIREALVRLNREGYSVNVDTYDAEPSFSHSECDICMSRLAGDRVPVTFIW